MKRLTVESGRAQLAVQTSDSGHGLPLLFLHAGVADQRAWAGQVQHFEQRHPVVTFDQRGYGETTYTPELHSPVDDVLAVMNATKLKQVVMIGNSMGGKLALDFTLAHPERVRALVLIGASIRGEPEVQVWPDAVQKLIPEMEAAEAAQDTDRLNELEGVLWLDGPDTPNRISGRVRDLFLDMNGQALGAEPTGDEVELPPAYDRLHEINAPTLLIMGDLDLPYIRANAEHAAQQLPQVTSQVMSGAAHLPALEQPEAFNALLESFLKELQ